MRQPKQVLVFPYKKNSDGNYLYAIFCRVGSAESCKQGSKRRSKY